MSLRLRRRLRLHRAAFRGVLAGAVRHGLRRGNRHDVRRDAFRVELALARGRGGGLCRRRLRRRQRSQLRHGCLVALQHDQRDHRVDCALKLRIGWLRRRRGRGTAARRRRLRRDLWQRALVQLVFAPELDRGPFLLRVHRHDDLRLHAVIVAVLHVLLAVHETPAWQVVVRDGQLQLTGLAVERDQLLNAALAVRLLADDQRPAVVHQTARDDFRGAGRGFVDQHDHRERLERSGHRRPRDLLRPVAALRAYDHALVDKQVDDLDRLVEPPAGVEPQVEDQSLHPLGQQLVANRLELVRQVGRELPDAEVADLGIFRDVVVPFAGLRALVAGDHGDDDLLARHRDVLLFAGGVADLQRDLRAQRTADALHNVRQPLAFDGLAVDGEDRIARHDARAERGAAFDGADHFYRSELALLIQFNADALERALEHAVEVFLPGRRDVDAERIQLAQHAADRRLAQGGFVGGVDVVLLDLAVDVDQRADECVIVVALGERAGNLEGEDGDEQHAAEPGEFFTIHAETPGQRAWVRISSDGRF